MGTSLIERALGVFGILAKEGAGAPLTSIAQQLAIPKSAAHRILGELIRLGYVRQDSQSERYLLTTRLVSLGFRHLASSGISDLVQPVLDGLANFSGELVRLAVVDGSRLTWVAKAQGARSGLRYDPEMGQDVVLFCTASGHAWLASFSDHDAAQIVARQGFGRLHEFGPNAPRTMAELLLRLEHVRKNGFATVTESGGVGTSALATSITGPAGQVVATISIAGPSARLTEGKMTELAPRLIEAANELSGLQLGLGSLAQPPAARSLAG